MFRILLLAGSPISKIPFPVNDTLIRCRVINEIEYTGLIRTIGKISFTGQITAIDPYVLFDLISTFILSADMEDDLVDAWNLILMYGVCFRA